MEGKTKMKKMTLFVIALFMLFSVMSYAGGGTEPPVPVTPPIPQSVIDALRGDVTQAEITMQPRDVGGVSVNVRGTVVNGKFVPDDPSARDVLAGDYDVWAYAYDVNYNTLFHVGKVCTVVADTDNVFTLEWVVSDVIPEHFRMSGIVGEDNYGDYPQIHVTTPDGGSYWGSRYRDQDGRWVYCVLLPPWFTTGTFTIGGNGHSDSSQLVLDVTQALTTPVDVVYTKLPNSGNVKFKSHFPGDLDCVTPVSNPAYVVAASGSVYSYQVHSDRMYVQNGTGLTVYDLTALPAIVTERKLSLQDNTMAFAVDDNYVYGFANSTLYVSDLGTGEALAKLSINCGGSSDLFLWKGYVYLPGCAVIDVTDPINPIVVGSLGTYTEYRTTFADGMMFCAAGTTTKVYRCNGADVSLYTTLPQKLMVATGYGNTVVGIDSATANHVVYDISDPAAPVAKGMLGDAYGTWDIYAHPCGYYYRPIAGQGTQIWDIANGRLVATMNSTYSGQMVVYNGYLLSQYSGSAIRVYDLSQNDQRGK